MRRTPRGRTWRMRRRRAKRNAENGTPPADHIDISTTAIDLYRWLHQKGFRNSAKLQICQFGTMGRGIRASRKAILALEDLMTLPVSCLMLPSEIRRAQPELYSTAENDEECLMMYLMQERIKIDAGLHSDWVPYVAILPRNYEYMFFLHPNARTLYANNPVVPKSFVQTVNETIDDMNKSMDNIKSLISQNETRLTFDEAIYKWAFSVMNTRSVNPNPRRLLNGVKDNTCLAPLFDMINHSLTSLAELETSLEKGFILSTRLPFRRYSQVFLNYNSDMSNREFSLHYGFCSVNRLDAAPTRREPPGTTLRISPSTQDFISFNFHDFKAILTEVAQQSKSRHALLLGTRIKNRLQLLDNMNYRTTRKVFQFGWPQEMFRVKDFALRFTDHKSLTRIRYESAKTREQLDVPIPASSIVVKDEQLEFLFKLLCKHKFGDIKRSIVTEPYAALPDLTIDTAEELQHYWTLKLWLHRGLLNVEYGIDLEGPVTTVGINQCLTSIDQSVMEPFSRVFRNELGLLFYMHHQIEDNTP